VNYLIKTNVVNKSKITTLLFLIFFLTSMLLAQGEKHSGNINEILESGGYSYFNVEEGDSTYWIAVRLMPAIIGAKIDFTGEMWMVDFRSKTLNRTFSRILFAANASIDRPDHHMIPMKPSTQNHIVLTGTQSIIAVKRSQNTLRNQSVTVQGEAIKVLHKIMGKTWIHLSDGDSDSSTIVITTLDNSVIVGMQVTVKGVLSVDRDFGMGYFYPSIIEDAVIIN